MIDLAARKWGNKWSHMWTDGDPDELHTMAGRLGLQRSYYQTKHKDFPHYDIIPTKRSQAIGFGAEISSIKEYLK